MTYQAEDPMLEMWANGAHDFVNTREPHPYDNPAHEDQLNVGRFRNPPGDAFHGDYLDFSRVEVASMCCCMFALLALVGVINALNPSNMHLVQKWAAQSWIQGHCEVEAVGIAYRGNCHTDVTLTMTNYDQFAECMGLKEKMGANVKQALQEWHHSEAGVCAARGDNVFQMDTGAILTDEEKEADGIIGRSSLPTFTKALTDPRTLPNALQERFLPGARIDCHNNYLPWALLHVDRSLISLVDNGTQHGMKPARMNLGLPSQVLQETGKTSWTW